MRATPLKSPLRSKSTPLSWQRMINNDILRSIRYMLDLSDQKVVQITKLANASFAIEKADVLAYLRKDDDPDYLACTDLVLAHFLDGLVIHCRGRNPNVPVRPVEVRITNNIVLKKLRVAFELKDTDLHQAFADAGFNVTKSEISALFRQEDQRNFRPCGDQMLRNFLKGLTLRARPVASSDQQ
jgi:uncharacterized protein YehS (DUF1456 family)